ncbi:MAG: AAA family ATPase [Nitrospirae bacterium]|nr:AAA family ATPase [Nitrospirota bacterium]
MTNWWNKIKSSGLAPDGAVAMGMISLFLVGWKIAAGLYNIIDTEGIISHPVAMFQPLPTAGLLPIQTDIRQYFTLAFGVFLASYIVTYSKIFISGEEFYSLPRGNKLFLYRTLPLVQSLTAGFILNIYRLSTAIANYSYGDKIMFQMWVAVLVSIIVSTWLIRYISPGLGGPIMPLLVFIAGALSSSSIANNGGVEALLLHKNHVAHSAQFIFNYLLNVPFPLGIIGGLLVYSAHIALWVCTVYCIARPYNVYGKWRGHQLGSAFNGITAITLVMFPYWSTAKNFLSGTTAVPSVMDAITFKSSTPYSYLVWSWLIANILTSKALINRFKLRPWRSLLPPTVFMQSAPTQISELSNPAESRPSVQAVKPQQESQPQPQSQPLPQTQAANTANIAAIPSEVNRGNLFNSIKGQQEALERLWGSALYPVLNGQKEFGNAILMGPTGVGKTETVKQIANIFYGGRLLRFNMNEYQTDHESTRLFGSAPGYIGYDPSGGLVQKGLRDLVPCVILFDEVEKTHPNLLDNLLQLTGEGYARGPEGQIYTANKSMIIMTSNIWPERANELWNTPQSKLKKDLRSYVTTRFTDIGPTHLFTPEFLGRVNTVVPYKPFTKEIAANICRDLLNREARARHIIIEDRGIAALADSIDVSEGYRGIENAISDTVGSFLDKTAPVQGKITYVLDTSVVMDDADIVFKLKGHVVIPVTVLKQLDGLKLNADSARNAKARQAARVLDDITAGGQQSTVSFHEGFDKVSSLDNRGDNNIIGAALKYQREHPLQNVVLVTSDVNMRTAARFNNVTAISAEEALSPSNRLIVCDQQATDASAPLTLSIDKKGGKLLLTLRTARGDIIGQESKSLLKGYAIDVKKLDSIEESPLCNIIGQHQQLKEIVDYLKISVSGFVSSPDRPMGVFLFAGPTGVGKTETAKALANWLFEGRLVRKNLGEYKSSLDGSRLFGDRYKMGDLTREVQELGSCVVLLDEAEKANREILDTFLALFDDGVMSDAACNVKVSFKNTVIIMTTNLKPQTTNECPAENNIIGFAPVTTSQPDCAINAESFANLSNDEKRDLFAYHFKQELLGRINRVIVYNPLAADATIAIIRSKLQKIVQRKESDEGIIIKIDDAVYAYLAERVRTSTYGARGIDDSVTNLLGSAVTAVADAEKIHIAIGKNGNITATKLQE